MWYDQSPTRNDSKGGKFVAFEASAVDWPTIDRKLLKFYFQSFLLGVQVMVSEIAFCENADFVPN